MYEDRQTEMRHILPLKLSAFDCEKLILHIQILRERASAVPREARSLLAVAHSLEGMLNEGLCNDRSARTS
jgi:hypothetical protein